MTRAIPVLLTLAIFMAAAVCLWRGRARALSARANVIDLRAWRAARRRR
jgi:hypothetical protein